MSLCSRYMPRLSPNFRYNAMRIAELLLFVMLIECSAAPISTADSVSDEEVAAYSILKTVILGYLAHAKTVRPDPSTITLSTSFKRMNALGFPTSGIYDAVGSMVKSFNADELLGIDVFNKWYKKHTKNKSDPPHEEASTSSDVAADTSDPNKILLREISSDENYTGTGTDTGTSSNTNTSQLYGTQTIKWITEYKEALEGFDIKENDNAPYLAALLLHLGPDKAKKVKHCLLNDNLFIGYNDFSNVRSEPRCKYTSKDMTVTGSGSMCKYQVPVCPSLVRYLPIDMLDQLQGASNIDNTSLTEVFVSAIQILYIVYECIRGRGERWSKIIMLVFLMMSILQTLSMLALHSQVAAFSIHCNNEEVYPDSQLTPKFTYRSSIMKYWNFCFQDPNSMSFRRVDFAYDVTQKCGITPQVLEKLFQDEDVKRVDISIQPGGIWELIVLIATVAVPLLLGYWAKYDNMESSRWFVLLWIVYSFFETIVYINYYNPASFINFRSHRGLNLFTFLLLVISAFLGLVLVIFATIFGYPVE
ncbi:hypothetical protein CLU79DRAFT_835503 [Phycomyces nitens]|nr:hypothetical protein CLU79DRAFT_835503 [Phycomyces nitens]